MRYLLKSAALESTHLKSIDVMCLDPDGSVEQRYREFVGLNRFRFMSVDATRLFTAAREFFVSREPLPPSWEVLELAHEVAMNFGK